MEQENWWIDSLQYSSRTDMGMRRSNNQDSHKNLLAATLDLWRTRGHLFIVADGMGAHAAGELASKLAVDTITQSYYKLTDIPPHDALLKSMYQAHSTIKSQGQTDVAFRDMGTTADAFLLLPNGALVVHVGDSRVYRCRNGVMEQLTFDHSLVWELRRSGHLPSGKIPENIPRNVITRSLGPTERLEADREGFFPLMPGDVFLLCSDGLSGQIDDDEMGQVISLLGPEEATEFLINLANLQGGPDNITVTVIKFLEMPDVSDLRPLRPLKKPRSSFTVTSLMFLAVSLTILIGSIFLFCLHRLPSHLWVVAQILSFATATGGFFFTARKTLFPETYAPVEEPFGHGPYTSVSARPNMNFVQKLVGLRTQLKQAISARNLTVNNSEIDSWIQQADQMQLEKLTASALQMNIKIINNLFNRIKDRRKTSIPTSSDDTITIVRK